jgi:hypothetical protein
MASNAIAKLGRGPRNFAAALLLSALSLDAAATAYYYDSQTVDNLGVVNWGSYQAFVTPVGGIAYGGSGQVPNACANGALYWDISVAQSKFWYNTLLAAKVSGLHVGWDITQDSYNTCYINSVRIQS